MWNVCFQNKGNSRVLIDILNKNNSSTAIRVEFIFINFVYNMICVKKKHWIIEISSICLNWNIKRKRAEICISHVEFCVGNLFVDVCNFS